MNLEHVQIFNFMGRASARTLGLGAICMHFRLTGLIENMYVGQAKLRLVFFFVFFVLLSDRNLHVAQTKMTHSHSHVKYICS